MRHERTHLMHYALMRATLKSLSLDPEPATLPEDPAEFSLRARMIVGPADGPGEESFDITVCTPEWLSQTCREAGFYDARHHVVVNLDAFEKGAFHRWLAARVESIQGVSWHEVGERIGRIGYWEFEDYRR
jgi:hypothetical protein